MNWDISDASGVLSAVFGLFAYLVGRQSFRHQQQYEGAYQTTITFQTVGVVSHYPSEDELKETVSIAVHYRGFETLRGVRVCLLFNEGYYWLLAKDLSLEPGEEFGPKYLEIPRSDLAGLRLHVSWPTPHPSTRRKGLRYQALRVSLDHELEEWRWLWGEWILRKLKHPFGWWKKVKRPPTSEKSFPGWPHGRPAVVKSWD